MSLQYRVGGRIAKKTIAERIKNLKITKNNPVEQQLPSNVGTLEDICTPPTSSDVPAAADTDIVLTSEKHPWEHGRRIVEIDHMANQMTCTDCGSWLALQNIVHEVRYGLGSVFMMECNCGSVNEVSSGKTHRVGKKGPPVFDVNTKAALGMMHSGIAHTQMTAFMASLEIDGLHHTTMKKREKEVEPLIQSVAKESCRKALATEIQLQHAADRQSTSTSPEEQPIKTACQFKYDMGWQKRGSGRAYDSKSGVGTLIGNRTGKICAYGVKNKDCRMCNFHINKGKVPPEHDCNRNWSGSSKAMEPSVAVDVIKEVESQNVEVSVLIMDDDATTMARIRDNISHPVQKWSDLNHTKKHLGNSLYSLQKKHKGFSNKCVQFIQKCFSYAVIQNKNKPEKLKSALCQIVPHAFGDHSHCESWCGYISNPETYRHKSLPHGKDLSGKELQEDLNNILSVYVTNAEKIAPAASTKDVESFNNVIASKAPKRIHYSGSSSLQNRVNCAVAEKNIGSHYVNRINTLAGISPGTIFKKYAERKDKIRKRRLLFENTREFKKQKLERKIKKNIVNAQCESREGVTYQSAVDLSDTTVVTEIPPAKQPLDIRKIELPVSYSRVYCDIETTSLSKTCEIVQIAAVSTDDKFMEYILPSHNIAPSASAVTGLHMQGNTLFYNGTPVAANPLQEALNLFLSWLSERKPCVLIGHNFKQFDFPRIIRALDKCDLKDALTESVIGIVDTLPLYREVCPGLLSYKQECLVSEILHECYVAHNAEEDVSSLQRLLSHTNPPDDVFVRHSTTVSSMIDMYMFDNETDANFDTLAHLVDQKVITRAIGLKIAKSGLQLKHLKFAYDRGLLDKVMLEKVNGKPRVTSTKRIILALDAFFSRQNSNEMSSTEL